MPDVLSRLEAHGPSGVALKDDGRPGTVLEAACWWLASVGVRRGLTAAPLPRVLLPVFTAYAESRGWDVGGQPLLERHVGLAFARLGCRREPGNRQGYLVARDVAAALWRAVGGAPPRAPAPKRRRSRPKPPRVTRHPSKPLRACDGRMWRSQRDAMSSLGTNAMAICKAVRDGTAVCGVHIRFATPAEVAAWRGEEWDGGIGSPS